MSKPKKAVTKVLDIISTVVIVLLLICVLSNFQTTILGKSYNSLFGYSFFEVKTGSMSGTLEVGDWILVKVTKDVEYNDVITFEQNGAIVTHRIVETYGDTIVTKGDSNNAKDDPITADNVIGKLVKVLPSFAIIKKTLLNEKVLILLFALIIVANSIFNKELTDKIKGIIKKKTKTEVKVDEAEEKVKETIKPAAPTSKTTLLSKVDVDFETSMISKVKDALEEDEKEEVTQQAKKEVVEDDEEESQNDETSIGVEVSESMYNKITAQDSNDDENKTESSGDVENLSLSALDKKSKKEILQKFIEEADARDEKDIEGFNEDLAIITKKLGIDEKIEIGRREKSIIKKYIALKRSEIKRLFYILLETNEESNEYKTIVNKYLDFYIETLYTRLCIKETAMNPLLSVSKQLAEYNEFLLHEATTDSKKKTINKVFLAANAILQIEISHFDDKVLTKIFNSPRMKYEDSSAVKKQFVHEHRKYNEAYKIFNKKIDSKKLYIELSKVDNYNLYTSKLNANIKFSKIFSDYIIDKTYGEEIIVESLKEVEIVQLTAEIVNDLMEYNARKKYLLYLPESMYKKSKKIVTMLKLIEDEYSQNKIYILITENIYKNYLDQVGELRKLGYKIILESDMNQLSKVNHGKIGRYVSNIIVIDKNKDVSLDELQMDTLNKNNFVITNKTCVTGVEIK